MGGPLARKITRDVSLELFRGRRASFANRKQKHLKGVKQTVRRVGRVTEVLNNRIPAITTVTEVMLRRAAKAAVVRLACSGRPLLPAGTPTR